ncbi:uncharacterized protein LOC127700811 [Mytilus californianus]|uniref:uncharacterized protein LOC127700811 n=1 Tax=Mytilus californianus TaxID=6549 RepID=UPI002245450A|nr:uncharacterized protein LOC127700811 [Mytilus californianus]XP_052060445.1 uncharacterized protein LOC127700811 [Mytilus californianus]
MTILTAGSCAFIITSTGNALPAVVGSAAGLIASGVKLWIQSQPLKVALATAVGTGTSSGAIAGAVATKTAANAFTGALIGGLSAGSVGSVMAGSIAVASGTLSSSPVGLLTVGTNSRGNQITHDCWKQVVHETSEEPSNGILLKELISHPNVADVTVKPCGSLPYVVIENTWNEKFELEYVALLDSDKLFLHVQPL